MAPIPQRQPELPFAEEAHQLLQRAQQGDQAVLPDLQRLLDNRPEIWQTCGDLAKHAEESLLGLAAGSNLLGKEAVRRKLAELKAELAGPDPPPLERLLVERVAVTWLGLHYAELDAVTARLQDQGLTSQSVYAQRRLDSANRRYLQALKQLALVRKLLKPPLPHPPAAPRAKSRKVPDGRACRTSPAEAVWADC